jgi:uncharacterized protein YyaL (SSP411 family)
MPIPEIAERRHMTPEKVEQVLSAARQRLFQVRSNRVPPGKDTKILVSWNGLAIRAFAEAGRILNRPAYLHAAEKAADFLLNSLRVDGRLVRSYKDGPSSIPAFLEDYAFLIEAVLTLYETAFDSRYLADARELVDQMVQYFWDDEQGCFFDVAADIEELVVRPRGFFDNPIPSGNAAATYALLRLEALTGDQSYGRRALAAFRVAADLMARAPLGFSYLLSALDFYFSPQVQIAIVGSIGSEDTGRLTRAVFDRYLPNKVVAVGEPEAGPLLAGRQRLDDRATAYVCEHFACKMPVTDVEALVIQLESPEG